MDHPEEQVKPAPERKKERPFLYTVILTMALVYFLVLDLMFISGLVFSGYVHDTLRSYAQPGEYSPAFFTSLALAGAVILTAALTGVILFMAKKKFGFYLFISTLLVIIILDLIFFKFDWMRYLIHSGFFFLLGVLHFSRRCYNNN